MSLKFTVSEDMGGYSLHVDTAQTNIEIGANENELRRMLIDLIHEFETDPVTSNLDYLVAECGLSPAEALDYWRVEVCGMDPQEWADSRGVGVEAVRKNVRQAREHLEVDSDV